jgi:hypothetical protein
MAMTKKDYEGIASYIAATRYTSTDIEVANALNVLTIMIADGLQDMYPRFDYAKFLNAAQYGKLPRQSEVA